MTEARGRGPRKGEGGRPAYRLDDDPDRRIVVCALWFWNDPEVQRSSAILQLLDALFTPYPTVELSLGTQLIGGTEYGRLSVTNTMPDRAPDRRTHQDQRRNVAPDRRPLSAPSGEAFRKSRLQLLQEKINHYRNKPLNEREESFYRTCNVAFAELARGNHALAIFALASAGWTISEAEGKRLAAILASKHADII